MYESNDDQHMFVNQIPALAPETTDAETKIAPFKVDGVPDRIHGAYLIFAFAQSQDKRIAYPAIVRRDLFDYLGGSDSLLPYWPDPESDFDSAWKRAVEIGLLTKVDSDNDDLGYILALEFRRVPRDSVVL